MANFADVIVGFTVAWTNADGSEACAQASLQESEAYRIACQMDGEYPEIKHWVKPIIEFREIEDE